MGILRPIGGGPLRVGGRFLALNPFTAAVGSGGSGGSTQDLAANDAFKVGNTLADFMIQRKAGTYDDTNAGSADVYVPFTFTGTAPASVQAQVVDMDSGAVIKAWTDLAGLVIDSATGGHGTLMSVPSGMDYKLQVRNPGNPTAVSSGTQRWGVGVNILIAGQSNMISTLTAGSYNDPISGSTKTEYTNWLDPSFAGSYFGQDGFVVPQNLSGSVGSSMVAPNFDTASGGGSAFLRLVGNALRTKYGRKIPVCASIWAWNGTSLADMTPPNGIRSQVYTNAGTAAGSIGYKSPRNYTPGDFEGIVLHQGEAEGGAGTRPARLIGLKTFYQAMLDIVAPYGRTAADLFFRPAVLGVYTQANNIENIRGAVYDLEAYAQANGWPRVKAGWNCIDLDTLEGTTGSDVGLHFRDVSGGNPYQKWSNRRMVQTAMQELKCATFSGMGPKISGVSRTGNVVTVTVSHEGGTALVPRNSGAALTGWSAHTDKDFDDANGHAVAASAVTITGANTISVTVAEFPCYLKYLGGKVGTANSYHPNVANPVYDNAAHPSGAVAGDQFPGLPLQPTPDSWKVL